MLLHKRRARRPSLAARSSRKAVCGKKGPPASTGQSEMHRACASCTGKIDLTGVPPPVRQAYLIAGPEHSLHHYRRIRHTTASEHRRRSRFFSALRRRASQAPPFRPSKSQKRATEKKSRRRASEQTCEEKPLFLPFSERGPFAPPPIHLAAPGAARRLLQQTSLFTQHSRSPCQTIACTPVIDYFFNNAIPYRRKSLHSIDFNPTLFFKNQIFKKNYLRPE